MHSQQIGSRRKVSRLFAAADVTLGVSILAIGLKFPTYWDHWVYFPTLPNILDTVVLTVAGVYMMVRGWRRWSIVGLRKDETALSPAISVVLMVAVTVILTIILYVMVTRWLLVP